EISRWTPAFAGMTSRMGARPRPNGRTRSLPAALANPAPKWCTASRTNLLICRLERSLGAYILRRLLLMIPTLFGIMAVSFAITQFAPGGPVEQALANLSGQNSSFMDRFTGSGQGDAAVVPQGDRGGGYRGSQGLPPELVERIEKQFGFDKPPLERFVTMIGNYLRFDFGRSYFRDISVIDL